MDSLCSRKLFTLVPVQREINSSIAKLWTMSLRSKHVDAPVASLDCSQTVAIRESRGHSWAYSLARITGLDALTGTLGRRSIFHASAIIVTLAVTSASFVSYAVWWLVTDVMPPNVIPISAAVAFLVSTPIATYLVSIIHSLAHSRAELASLSEELIVARDRASEANQAKSNLLASTSHELRTPLNAIIGFSDVIQAELFGPCSEKRYVGYARDIHESGKLLLNLINDVLDLSKIEAGQNQIDTHGKSELTLVIEDTAKIVGVMAKQSGVELRVTPVYGSIWVEANDRIIRQIVLNLLSNAVKFTPEGGCVTVSSRLGSSSDVIVEIADNGIGMTDEELKVAMQPFGQINSNVSRRHAGTGLGLPLSKAMVELHGGTLTIQSIHNQGTSVTFSLPSERLLESPAALREIV
jgi:signal transduction histidine kinase